MGGMNKTAQHCIGHPTLKGFSNSLTEEFYCLIETASEARTSGTASPDLRSKASDNPIAASIASFVPEPIEKCAVCAASPIKTMFS